MTPAISVICPIYNMESSLGKCIDSIRQQTFYNFELILIDDGSKDRSGAICDEYARFDDRIIVIHKTNAGVSAARQTGIDTARGEYTIHVDPDDWVEPEMLEVLYREASSGDYDLVVTDFFENSASGQIYKRQKPSALNHTSLLYDIFEGELHANCWNKLIRRSCYLKYSVQFPQNLSLREDFCVMVQLLLHPLKIGYINQAFYHYVQTPNSISRTINDKIYHDQITVIENISSYLKDRHPRCLNILKADVSFWLIEHGYMQPCDFRKNFVELLSLYNFIKLPFKRQIKILSILFLNQKSTQKLHKLFLKTKTWDPTNILGEEKDSLNK